MAHLSKPLCAMKRILILLLALMPVMMSGQGYKNLPKIEVPDTPATQINITEREFPVQTYTASHMLASRGINARVDIPPTYDLFMKTTGGKTMMVGTKAVLLIGGEEYQLRVTHAIADRVTIDVQLSLLTHMSFSGLQGIRFENSAGKVTHEETFNDIQQELWRRTSEQIREIVMYIFKP